MAVQRMDNVLIVVEDLDAVIAFFLELGLELEGRTTVEGPELDKILGLEGVRADIVVVRTPDGQGRVELTRFHTPVVTATGPRAEANTPGIRRIMFAVDDIEDTITRLRAHGAELVGTLEEFGGSHRLCFVRGPENIMIGLAERITRPGVPA